MHCFCDQKHVYTIEIKYFQKGFFQNTIYVFLKNAKINWQKFTTLLSTKVINEFFRKLTGEERQNVFIIDDSIFDRSGSKKTDMLARVYKNFFVPAGSIMVVPLPKYAGYSLEEKQPR